MGKILYQALCTVISCYLCMSVGIIFTWPSCTLRIFESANTTLHRPMQETELALFGSLSSIGALISTPLSGWALDRIGRKMCLVSATVFQTIAWTMIASCNRVEVILTAVFVSGLGGAAFLVVPVYISEICQESIRGSMTAGSMIFYGFGIIRFFFPLLKASIGMLLSYVLGGCLPYNVMVYVCLSITALSLVLVNFLRETPLFLMKKGLEEEAAKAFAFYRNTKVDSKVVLEEMNALRRAFNTDMDNDDDTSTPEAEKLNPVIAVKKIENEKLSLLQFIKKSKSTQKAFVLTIVLMTASLFQGLIVVQVYAEPLFAEAVPTMSPTVCSVILAVLTVVFGVVAAYLSDVAGRKPLLIYASLGSGLCCIVLGTQLQMHWGPHWLTAVFIYLFTIFYTLGAGTVPYVLVCEVFLPEIKSFMSMFVIEWAWLCNFVILFIFNPLVNAIGLGAVFYLFAAVCFFTSVYSVFNLPETKGLPVDVIQNMLIKKSKKKQPQKY